MTRNWIELASRTLRIVEHRRVRPRQRRPGGFRLRPELTGLEVRTMLSAIPTSTYVTASTPAAVYGQAVSLTAKVSANWPGSGTPTGKVTFYDGATTLGAATLSSQGTASLTAPLTAVGEQQIAASYSGDPYFAASAAGNITTVAGDGKIGYSGDGGSATSAELDLSNPIIPTLLNGVAVDAAGDLFIADTGNNVVREVKTSGIITTIAGNGTAGYIGDNGPATGAKLSGPSGLAVDAAGDLFIADTFSHVIRRVTVPAAVVVSPDATTTAVTASPSTAVYGQAITFTATVSVNSPGTGMPTGTVTFSDGTTTLGTVTLNGYAKATLTTSTLTVGAHSITAKYSGDTDDYSSTSTAGTVQVTNLTMTPGLSSLTTALILGQASPATTTVSGTNSGTGPLNGSVTVAVPIDQGTSVVVPLDGLPPDGGSNGPLTIASGGEIEVRASRSAKGVLK